MRIYLIIILSSLYLSSCAFGPSSKPRAEFSVQIHSESFYTGKIVSSYQFYRSGGKTSSKDQAKCFPLNLKNICSHKKYEAIDQADALLITTTMNSENVSDANLINEKTMLAAAQFSLENGYQFLIPLITENTTNKNFLLVKDFKILKKGLFTNQRWGLEPYQDLYDKISTYRNHHSAEKIFGTYIVKYGNVKYETVYPKTVASNDDQL